MLGFAGLSLLAWLASTCVTGVNLHGWYGALMLPGFLPSAALLARLWGTLAVSYLATGLAAWLVWRRPRVAGRQRAAMNFWGWQLALGAAWPAAFFGLHVLLAAAAAAAALVAISAGTVWRFAALDKMAAALLLPYLGFALATLYISAGFWWLNH